MISKLDHSVVNKLILRQCFADNDQFSAWSAVPEDILILILKELYAPDVAQCSRVCLSWHQALQGSIIRQ